MTAAERATNPTGALESAAADLSEPVAAEPPRRPRRPRTARPTGAAPAGYNQAWKLFGDWCAATDHQVLPADPATVLEFLAACPAAAATQRRRVAAIDHHHTAAGHPAPGDHDDIRGTVGRPPRERGWVCPDQAAVDTALRALPSHGFTQGLFGQRDRALLVLAQIAGLPYRAIAAITAANLHHDPVTGTITITTGGRTRVVEPREDAVVCPACVLTRWLRTHAVTIRHIATSPLVDHLTALDPATDTAAHDCRHPVPVATNPVPLLIPVNQWGHVPFPAARLSPHAVSCLARNLLSGDHRIHRDLTTGDTTDHQPVSQAQPEQTPRPAPPYRAADRDAAWNRRRDDLQQLATVTADLAHVEQRAAELNQRITELLDAYAL